MNTTTESARPQSIFPFTETDAPTQALLESAQGRLSTGVFLIKHTVQLHNPDLKEAAVTASRISEERQRIRQHFPSSILLLQDPSSYKDDELKDLSADEHNEIVESTASSYVQLMHAGCSQVVRHLGPIALEERLIDENWLIGRRVIAGLSTDEQEASLVEKTDLLANLHNPIFLEIPVLPGAKVSKKTLDAYKYIRDTLRKKGGRDIGLFILKICEQQTTSSTSDSGFIKLLNTEHPDKIVLVDPFSATAGSEDRFQIASAISGIGAIKKGMSSLLVNGRVVRPRIHGLMLPIVSDFHTHRELPSHELDATQQYDPKKPKPPRTASRVLCPGSLATYGPELVNEIWA